MRGFQGEKSQAWNNRLAYKIIEVFQFQQRLTKILGPQKCVRLWIT